MNAQKPHGDSGDGDSGDGDSGMGEYKKNAQKLLGGGATIRIGREILCLPYAGFLSF